MRTPYGALQRRNDVDGLVEDTELGLGLVGAGVQLAHPTQLLEGLVDVAHPDPGLPDNNIGRRQRGKRIDSGKRGQ